MKIDFNVLKNNDFKCILFYGEDISSVKSKFDLFLNKFNGYDIYDISPENIKSNFLEENFFSVSMFSKNTLYTLKLTEKENDLTKHLENICNNKNILNCDNILVITTGQLDTKSSLRKYSEKSEYVACVACYEEVNVEFFISNKLKEYGFLFNNDIINYILHNVGKNTLIIKNELEKLNLYKNGDKNLTIEDLRLCIKDISDSKLNDFCNEFCSLNLNSTIRIYKKLINEGNDTIMLIRILTKYFLQLQKIRNFVDGGENIDEVLKREKIFWKQINIMKNHVNKWNIENINKILQKLLEIEKFVKFNENKNMLFENFIMKSLLFFNKR